MGLKLVVSTPKHQCDGENNPLVFLGTSLSGQISCTWTDRNTLGNVGDSVIVQPAKLGISAIYCNITTYHYFFTNKKKEDIAPRNSWNFIK